MFDYKEQFWWLKNTSVIPTFKDFHDYFTDSAERSVIFMDVMRRRGDEMLEMTNKTSSTVLHFDYEIILDGKDFARPINYWLAKVIPPEGVDSDPAKRPYVVQDPRAGQGPGIGGFKSDSEIGDALKNGHPVYFIGFNSVPEPEQGYEDIIKGQLRFYECVASLHPNSPKMCIIGNCAAGYLSMFSAMQKPELFGPILIAGSPLSYWNGTRGRYPMRYMGGLVGGVWINSYLGDLGGGRFDGTYLILNFDLLNLANFLWGKQYDLYANIDKDSDRYLQFEKWWGDFIQFNTQEITWLVDKLFIGNQLTTGNLITKDGIRLDPRAITSPIITFISDGDNISPPSQSAGWIADLYHDEKEIEARGKTIVYCLNHKVGHLAIFTATKVGRREDEMFVENMDTIDMLPPGLYELVLETPEGMEQSGHLESRYEARTINDIKNLGYNSLEDDRAFATVAEASSAIDFVYTAFVHPWFKITKNSHYTSWANNFNPLRLSYMLFSEAVNPWMKIFEFQANEIGKKRIEIDNKNPFLQLQETLAAAVSLQIENYQAWRDNVQEQLFFLVWGNPLVQKFWGTDLEAPRYIPAITQIDRAQVDKQIAETIIQNLPVNTKLEALFRIVCLILYHNKSLSERVARILLTAAREMAPETPDSLLKETIRKEAMVVAYNKEQAEIELRKYSVSSEEFSQVLTQVRSIVKQVGTLPAEIEATISRLAKSLNIV